MNIGGFFEKPETFITKEDGKAWLNEVEGLINQKCPEADLRVENVLTNELFSRHRAEGIQGRQGGICDCVKEWMNRDFLFLGNEAVTKTLQECETALTSQY